MNIFLFVAAILSMIATAVIVHLVCRHTQLKALLTGIAFQLVKQTETISDVDQMQQHCTAQWYTIAALTLMIVALTVYICLSMQKCTIFKRRLYSNTLTVMLFFSGIKQYIPVKLCKSAGSIHLFKIYGQLTFMILNRALMKLPILVKILLRDKYRLRALMRIGHYCCMSC